MSAKHVAGAVALALVLFGMSGGAEADAATPPPPPYDDVTPPQDFTEFWAAGPRPGVRDRVEWAVTPAEGRALCEHYQRWDAYGEVVDCLVKPRSQQPNVDEPGWLNDWAGQNGFPVIGGSA